MIDFYRLITPRSLPCIYFLSLKQFSLDTRLVRQAAFEPCGTKSVQEYCPRLVCSFRATSCEHAWRLEYKKRQVLKNLTLYHRGQYTHVAANMYNECQQDSIKYVSI